MINRKWLESFGDAITERCFLAARQRWEVDGDDLSFVSRAVDKLRQILTVHPEDDDGVAF